mmetsp:Transcript_13647/g.45112  ORF Transcript_13647/g.45112 Transcript_13647/m.45112 type:complete len:232 (+) Transcript_13647:871-1566(+)
MSTTRVLLTRDRVLLTRDYFYSSSHFASSRDSSLLIPNSASIPSLAIPEHALHPQRQSSNMNLGFFRHSPAFAQALQVSCLLSHPGGACGGGGATHRNGRAWIHFVAVHFVPLMTGHPACMDLGSILFSDETLQNNNPSPFLGFTATLPSAHSLHGPFLETAMSWSIHSLSGKAVSPPSSTSDKYSNTVATRCPPSAANAAPLFELNSPTSWCASYFSPMWYRSTCMSSPW